MATDNVLAADVSASPPEANPRAGNSPVVTPRSAGEVLGTAGAATTNASLLTGNESEARGNAAAGPEELSKPDASWRADSPAFVYSIVMGTALVLYMLSPGPMLLVARSVGAEKTFEPVFKRLYSPLLWAHKNIPPVRWFYDLYLPLWGVKR